MQKRELDMSNDTLRLLLVDDKTMTTDMDRAGYRTLGISRQNSFQLQSS